MRHDRDCPPGASAPAPGTRRAAGLPLTRCALLALLPLLGACALSVGGDFPLADDHAAGGVFMGVRLLGTVALPSVEVDGLKVTELSALAWDEDEGILYALGDQGTLFHLRPRFAGGRLAAVDILKGLRLRGPGGAELGRRDRDAEGMAVTGGDNGLRGDSELIVSFELHPRLARYRPQDAAWAGEVELPEALRDVGGYRGANKALESVTVHRRLGVLTAPEWPLKGLPKDILRIYDMKGGYWQADAYPAPNSAVVALEALDDGSVLVLERAFVSLFAPVIISLRRLWIGEECAGGAGTCRVEQVAVFDSSRGWRIDNFEGMTRYRDGRFFIVSDDNERAIQRTLLSFFEVTGLR